MLRLAEKDRQALAKAVSIHSENNAQDTHGAYLEQARVSALLDQKATSALTFLALLLAGASLVLATSTGADMEGVSRAIWGIIVLMLYGAIFAAAFLCLSCTRLLSIKDAVAQVDEQGQFLPMPDVLAGRYVRFVWAFWFTVAASALLFVIIVFRVVAEYFL